ncbi:hypothetical protein KQI52_08995 [bacterium]|nr:hypothetical protein [bacterium]
MQFVPGPPVEDDERDRLEGLRRRVIDVLEVEGKPMRAGEPIAAVGCNKNYGQELLKKMLKGGLIARPEYGVYAIPER